MSFAAVSKHLRVLEGAGLVTRGRDAQYRPATLAARPLQDASAWLGDYRIFWAESFDALDTLLDGLTEPGLTEPGPAAAAETPSPEARKPGTGVSAKTYDDRNHTRGIRDRPGLRCAALHGVRRLDYGGALRALVRRQGRAGPG